MRKGKIIAVISAIAIMIAGCGAAALKTPVVTDGVMEPGEEAINVVFNWEPVAGADGYEVLEENKYCTEEEFREPDAESTSYTDQTTFVSSAQDDFDFRIKVRAYKGDGDSRQYSEWSEYAFGSSYEK